MSEAVVLALITALSSGSVVAFIQFLITRKDQEKEKQKSSNDDLMKKLEEIQSDVSKIKADTVELKKETKRLEKDGLRTQMLEMINDYPDNESEILTLAEHYFKDLNGNWYATNIFTKWMERNYIAKPAWFEQNKNG